MQKTVTWTSFYPILELQISLDVCQHLLDGHWTLKLFMDTDVLWLWTVLIKRLTLWYTQSQPLYKNCRHVDSKTKLNNIVDSLEMIEFFVICHIHRMQTQAFFFYILFFIFSLSCYSIVYVKLTPRICCRFISLIIVFCVYCSYPVDVPYS